MAARLPHAAGRLLRLGPLALLDDVVRHDDDSRNVSQVRSALSQQLDQKIEELSPKLHSRPADERRSRATAVAGGGPR